VELTLDTELLTLDRGTDRIGIEVAWGTVTIAGTGRLGLTEMENGQTGCGDTCCPRVQGMRQVRLSEKSTVHYLRHKCHTPVVRR